MKEGTKMTLRMLGKMILQNFKMQRHVILPFILALSMMFGTEFILLSLYMNEYVRERSQLLPGFVAIGNIFMCMLGFIFILYANRFMMKRRQQELAMNMILGMEKKHFRIIMFIEMVYQYIIIAVLSITGGYLFGALIFMLLNKLMQQTGMSLMDYPFNLKAMVYTLLMLAFVMLFLFSLNNIKILFQSPIKLITQRQKTEKRLPTPVLYLLFIIGLSALIGSYHIALSDQLIIRSLYNLFGAILLVMIGTYCLFMSLGILLLDWLQRLPRIYYNPKYFFTISGLRSRMNSNAVGLASITMLCTFLIVTLGMSVSTYRGIEQRLDTLMATQYRVTLNGNIHNDKEVQKKAKHIEQDIRKHAKVDFFRTNTVSMIAADYGSNGVLLPRENKFYSMGLKSTFLIIMTQHDYNELNTEKVHLKPNETGLSSDSLLFKKLNNVTLMDETVTAKQLNGHNYSLPVPGSLTIVTPDSTSYQHITNYYMNKDKNDNKDVSDITSSFIHFNIMTKDTSHFDKVSGQLSKKYIAQIESKKGTGASLYELNGGLIFIGVVVSIILLLGTFLMMYYKNIAEGYEDRRNYQIMQKVGIEEERIKATINNQIMWIFILPIIVATIHVVFASKMIFNTLGILSINNVGIFATSYIGVIVAVIIIYAIMYWITSRIYYFIVNSYS